VIECPSDVYMYMYWFSEAAYLDLPPTLSFHTNVRHDLASLEFWELFIFFHWKEACCILPDVSVYFETEIINDSPLQVTALKAHEIVMGVFYGLDIYPDIDSLDGCSSKFVLFPRVYLGRAFSAYSLTDVRR